MKACSDDELVSLLEAYQLQDPNLSEKFAAIVRPILFQMAKKHGFGFSEDVLDEVVQEVFLALLNPALVRFDRERGTAKSYLLGRVMNAVKTAQLGEGLRRAGTDFEAEAQREFVALDDALVPASSGVSIAALHARDLLGQVFAGLKADVVQACCRVWGENEPVAAVALDLGMSRFALARKLSAVKQLSAKYAAFA